MLFKRSNGKCQFTIIFYSVIDYSIDYLVKRMYIDCLVKIMCIL
jgi:hypothetical protein